MNPGYKEIWQDFYDDALERGFSETFAAAYADEKAIERRAALADDAHDRAKDAQP